ncbi:MAG TPA: response regulator [Candidatus Methylacidiphilales bacterium]|nr:response regulator [Candidatus Methylacidiphilales bacterium]
MPHQILIIDDQHDILRILEREFLKNKLATILTASNIAQAVSIVEQRGIDLLITDVRIGTENGFDLVKQVRERSPGTGLMMMTAYRSPGLRQMADQLGVAFFIEKPFAVSNLLHAVEHFFATRPADMRPTVQTAPPSSNTMNALGHFSAQELVQLFCLNGRSVLISMSSFNNPMAKIYIQKGRVMHCEYGELLGEKAFYAALRLQNPQLGIEDYALPVPQTVDNSWEWLLLEAARMADEAAQSQPPPQPDPHAIFTAASHAQPAPAYHQQAPAPSPVPALNLNPATLFPGPPPPVTPVPAAPPPPVDPFADFWKQAKLGPGARLNVS